MVEAAAIGLGALEDFRHAGGGVALFPEKVAGGIEQDGRGSYWRRPVVERSFKSLD